MQTKLVATTPWPDPKDNSPRLKRKSSYKESKPRKSHAEYTMEHARLDVALGNVKSTFKSNTKIDRSKR